MALKLVTAALDYPLTLAEVKAHLRVDDSDHDTEIEALLAANTAYAENLTGRALIDQVWDVYLDEFPDCNGAIKLPRSPVIEVVGVFYRASGTEEQELGASSYDVDIATEPGRITPVYSTSWPSTGGAANSLRVRFRAGFVDLDVSPSTGAVPDDIKQAIILRIKADYDQGDDAERLRSTAESMLMRRRVETGMA